VKVIASSGKGIPAGPITEIVGHGEVSLVCVNVPTQKVKTKIVETKKLFIHLD
jgi:hypothetical protein